MKLRRPLKYCITTQPFGVNYVNFYQDLGMKGHNGIDFKCYENEVYASFDGVIKYAGKYSDGGIGIEIISDHKDNDGHFKVIYYHLKSIHDGIKKDNRVLGGQPIGISDNTGKYTTGNHLHWGIKRCSETGATSNYYNGFHGAINPEPFLKKGFYNLPVDERYGQVYSLLEEIRIKIKHPFLNKEQLKAMVYGSYSYSEVINPALKPIWAMLMKQEYLGGKKPDFKLSI